MEIYKLTSKDKIDNTQKGLPKNYLSSDTWGALEVHLAPEEAEKAFCKNICSANAEKEQIAFEQLSQRFPDKYGHIVPADKGKITYSIFPTGSGSKILFTTNYAQKPIKKIFTTKSMGPGMKIHTAKIRNRFEPTNWKQECWFYVAYALITGNETEFAPVSRYH